MHSSRDLLLFLRVAWTLSYFSVILGGVRLLRPPLDPPLLLNAMFYDVECCYGMLYFRMLNVAAECSNLRCWMSLLNVISYLYCWTPLLTVSRLLNISVDGSAEVIVCAVERHCSQLVFCWMSKPIPPTHMLSIICLWRCDTWTVSPPVSLIDCVSWTVYLQVCFCYLILWCLLHFVSKISLRFLETGRLLE